MADGIPVKVWMVGDCSDVVMVDREALRIIVDDDDEWEDLDPQSMPATCILLDAVTEERTRAAAMGMVHGARLVVNDGPERDGEGE